MDVSSKPESWPDDQSDDGAGVASGVRGAAVNDDVFELTVEEPDNETEALVNVLRAVISEPKEAQGGTEDVLLLEHELDPAGSPRDAEAPPAEPFIRVSFTTSENAPMPKKAVARQTPLLVAVDSVAGTDVTDVSASLEQQLEHARVLAQAAGASETRSHGALYDALGCAYDLALTARSEQDHLLQLLQSANISMQQRAPMTPIVKLVFGIDYDKKRLTEYAAALGHAERIGLGRGTLARFLRTTEGGLKSVVREERRLRGLETRQSRPVDPELSAKTVRALRELPTSPLSELSGEGDEFVLVLARRTPEGTAVMIGEVPRNIPLLERTARMIMDARD